MKGSNANPCPKEFVSSFANANSNHDRHIPTIDFFDVHNKENTPNPSLERKAQARAQTGIDLLVPSAPGLQVLHSTPIKAKAKSKVKTVHKSQGANKCQSPNMQVLKRKKNPTIMSSLKKKGGKLLKRTLTPPRHLDVGCGKTPSRPKTPGQKLLFGEDEKDRNRRYGRTCTDDDNENGAENLTLSPKFKNATQYEIRSCEMDPSNFQLEIPSHDRVLANCKLCVTMDNYVELVGVDFDFSDLMPWGKKKINANVSLNTSARGATRVGDHDGDKSRGVNVNSNGEQAHAQGTEGHQILVNLQSAVSDIVVEGFFREYYEDANREDGLGRVEVCIFSSHALNQIFVVYRGSSDVQDRPINGAQEKAKVKSEVKGQTKKDILDNNQEYLERNTSTSKKLRTEKDLNALIFDAYNCNLEESVFTLLNRLTGLRPFCDVTMVGHSFGGALSTIAAYKYAMSRPATRVRCQTFGSPRLGGADFRNDVHSLPNLNVVKIERSTDPFISLPEGVEWSHVGHTLRINQSALASLGMRMPAEMRPVEFQLYRFDKHRPGTNIVTTSVNSVNNLRKLKIGNEIKSYQKDLDKVDSLNLPWVDSFVGFETEGKQISSGYYA